MVVQHNLSAMNTNRQLSGVQSAQSKSTEKLSSGYRINRAGDDAAGLSISEKMRSQIRGLNKAASNASEINRIQSTTQFNTMNLLDGTFSSKNLQVGSLSGQSIGISIKNMNASSLGVDALKVSSFASAGSAMDKIQSAINLVSTQRSTLGALQNRLEHTINNLNTTAENTQAAESRIRDVDMATEMVEYSKNNILAQAGQSMLAQANQATQGVLSLLG